MPAKRVKVDGTKFEGEFRDCIKDKFYIKRLPTLNTGFAGLRQPADFIVVGKTFNYVELKETAQDRFSVRAMEQFDLMFDFLTERNGYVIFDVIRMEYWLIVHFIEKGVYKAITGQEAFDLAMARKSLRWDSKIGKTFTSLKELRGGIKF